MDALNAKIKAMRARLPTASDYMALCQPGAAVSIDRSRLSFENELARLRRFLADTEGRKLIQEREPMEAWAYARSLQRGQNRSALTYITGTEIDLQNILTIYRLKRYYASLPAGADIYPHLTPICYRLRPDELKQMAESPGIFEFIIIAKHTPYGLISFEDPEADIFREMSRVYSKMAKRYPRSMAAVLGYIFARRAEIRNLTAIIEGHKYNLPPEEIFKLIRI